MSGRSRAPRRVGIRAKLFGLLLALFLVNLLVLALAGSTLFERFYVHNKVAELKSSAKALRGAYRSGGNTLEALFEPLNLVENRNAVAAVLSFDEAGGAQIAYHTRERQQRGWQRDGGPDFAGAPEDKAGQRRFAPPLALDDGLIGRAGELGEGAVLIDEQGGFDGNHISLLARLDAENFLYMETPRDYIRSTAELAVRYTASLSAGILLVGAVGLYLLAGRATRPIRHMQGVADKIAHLDFSESCPVRSRDELGALAGSINNMSRELQGNIEKLVAANAVLQSDLLRQQKTDLMRRRFVQNVSHDFKTPLTLIVSYAEALSGAQDAAEADAYRAIIIEEGNRLSRLVGRLLRLSQLESGTLRAEPSIFCLDEIIDPVVASHRILSDRKGLKIEKRLDEDFIVEADFQLMGQVVANLFENAVKYAPAGAAVRILAAEREGKCEVSVYNDGPPVPQDAMENLFESFYRADAARSQDGGRSFGLGLAMVRATQELHGEGYGCENAGAGVRFWFTMKLAALDGEG